MIKAIIFDIGGVVTTGLHNSWSDILAEMSSSAGVDTETLIASFRKFENEIHTGRMSLRDFYARTKQANKYDPEEMARKHIEVYARLFGRYNQTVLDLIERLRQRYTLACFTNTEIEVAEFHKAEGLYKRFDYAFVSTDMHLKKPDPRSYNRVIETLGIRPEEGVFIDNNSPYVEEARKIGLKGIVFESSRQLIRELKALSVDVS